MDIYNDEEFSTPIEGSSTEHVLNQKGKSIMNESSESVKIDNEEYWPLSGKPCVEMILKKSAVNPIYSLYLPKIMNKYLPSAGAHVILTYGQKKWDLFYGGAEYTYKFRTGWKKFADDNNLKKGDGLVFELSECSTTKIEFRAQILQGALPAIFDVEGKTNENPIIID